ncbi:hypothetical protein M885DRAFT_296545 [Pelagophyceae sp. CCMP2097]|nr:hypothetical protein M885DRAFT_296545 [Pelagophyceae sp. CCMP2097]
MFRACVRRVQAPAVRSRGPSRRGSLVLSGAGGPSLSVSAAEGPSKEPSRGAVERALREGPSRDRRDRTVEGPYRGPLSGPPLRPYSILLASTYFPRRGSQLDSQHDRARPRGFEHVDAAGKAWDLFAADLQDVVAEEDSRLLGLKRVAEKRRCEKFQHRNARFFSRGIRAARTHRAARPEPARDDQTLLICQLEAEAAGPDVDLDLVQ